jgi:hypothetical protein
MVSLEVWADHQQAFQIVKEIIHIHNLIEDSIMEELAIGGVD